MKTPTASYLQTALDDILQRTEVEGNSSVAVIAGDLHRRVGSYPQQNRRIPISCEVMRHNMDVGNTVLHEPPKGKGATLEI
jgi:5-methylcytosine-specific restriction protein A